MVRKGFVFMLQALYSYCLYFLTPRLRTAGSDGGRETVSTALYIGELCRRLDYLHACVIASLSVHTPLPGMKFRVTLNLPPNHSIISKKMHQPDYCLLPEL